MSRPARCRMVVLPLYPLALHRASKSSWALCIFESMTPINTSLEAFWWQSQWPQCFTSVGTQELRKHRSRENSCLAPCPQLCIVPLSPSPAMAGRFCAFHFSRSPWDKHSQKRETQVGKELEKKTQEGHSRGLADWMWRTKDIGLYDIAVLNYEGIGVFQMFQWQPIVRNTFYITT